MTETPDRIRRAPVGLGMPRAPEAPDHAARKLEQGRIPGIEALDALPGEECATRETRRIDAAPGTAGPMPMKTPEGFDFPFRPSPDRERIAAPARLDLIRGAGVVHFPGPPGTGGPHLATAPGVAAVKAGQRVCRATSAEPAEAPASAGRGGRPAGRIRFHVRPSPPIVDGTGYPSVTRGGENPFLQPVNARHGKGAMIPASNRGFAGWGDVSGGSVVATALPDRPPHHAVAVRIGGAGHRPRGHTDLIPEHPRTDAPVTPPPPPERRGRPPGNGTAGHRTGRQPKPPDRGMSNRPFWGN